MVLRIVIFILINLLVIALIRALFQYQPWLAWVAGILYIILLLKFNYSKFFKKPS